MCANCGFPAAQGHWTDAGAGSAFDRIRGRLQRVRILTPVLACYGLAVHDDGSGFNSTLASQTGHQVVVNNLSELWEAAERIAGRPVDPLDPCFVGEAPAP
ncbi:MAG TPA: hypothetical protein VIJ63_11735 [Roseiarcus sp.]